MRLGPGTSVARLSAGTVDQARRQQAKRRRKGRSGLRAPDLNLCEVAHDHV